jgi:hypothetical protein
MNYIKARCGHDVPAVGAPGSMARKAAERRACGLPRCESGLPDKFTDRECAAWVWMWGRMNWIVDLATKGVVDATERKFPSLIEFAQHYGWDG